MKINKNEASSSSESEVKKDGSCLMHFVDKRFFDHVYIANGALVNINKVLTTRDVLQPYENNIKQEELFVYHEEWKNDNLTQKVTEVYIDKRGISKLAVAKVSTFVLVILEHRSWRPPPRFHAGAYAMKRAVSVCPHFLASISRCRLLSQDRNSTLCN